MVIIWYGENCFKVQSGSVTLITDPPSKNSGLKQPRFKHDIFLQSLIPVPAAKSEIEEAFSIIGPGEYEIKGMFIRGFPLPHESTSTFLKNIYLINDGELNLCYLGHMSAGSLEPSVVEWLSEVDVLIIPGGGKPFLPQEAAVKLINQIEPSIVIPSSFKVPGLIRKADPVTAFLKEIGSQTKPMDKVTIKKRDLVADETRVVVLETAV